MYIIHILYILRPYGHTGIAIILGLFDHKPPTLISTPHHYRILMILYNRVKSTFMVDGDVYRRIRILAINKNVEVSKLIEEAMREKLEREDPEYQSQPQPQPQPQSQSQLSKILKLIKENPDMIKKLKHELPPAVLRNIEKGAFESKEVKIDPTYEQKIKNIVETKKATKT